MTKAQATVGDWQTIYKVNKKLAIPLTLTLPDGSQYWGWNHRVLLLHSILLLFQWMIQLFGFQPLDIITVKCNSIFQIFWVKTTLHSAWKRQNSFIPKRVFFPLTILWLMHLKWTKPYNNVTWHHKCPVDVPFCLLLSFYIVLLEIYFLLSDSVQCNIHCWCVQSSNSKLAYFTKS
jgi:hypothetical protein